VLLDFGDPVARVVERLPAAAGGKDQLGTSISRVRASLEIAEPFEVADQFGRGGQTELRTRCQVRQPDAVNTHTAEDMQMGLTQVWVTICAGR